MSSSVRCYSISDQVALIAFETFELPAAAASQHLLDDKPIASPMSMLDLQLPGGRRRRIIACRLASTLQSGAVHTVTIRNLSDSTAKPISASGGFHAFDPATLLQGLQPEGLLRLARLLFEFCAVTFRLTEEPRFVAAARKFLQSLPGGRIEGMESARG